MHKYLRPLLEAIKTINQQELLPPNKVSSFIHTTQCSVIVTFAVVSGVALGIEWLGLVLHGEGIEGDDAAISVGSSCISDAD